MKFTITTMNDNGSGMEFSKKEDFLREITMMVADCIENGGTFFDVIEIDSCEYIVGNAGYKGYLAHKGNCKYCAKRNEQR